MDVFSTLLILFLIFWVLIYILDQKYDLSRINLEISVFQFIIRTGRLTSFIDGLTNALRPVWKLYSLIGVGVGVAALLLTTSNFLYVGKTLFEEPSSATGVQVVIPGVTLPLTYSLIAIISVVVVHEFSHGIVARLSGISLKSVGVGVLAILPFAFVEPDEESMKGTSAWNRVKVYSAGSMANFTLAFVAMILLFGLVVPQLSDTGLTIGSVEEGQPGDIAGLEKGMVLEWIEYGGIDYEIRTHDDFVSIMESSSPGEPIKINTNKGTFEFNLGKHYERDIGYIGIVTYDRSVFKKVNPLVAYLYPPLVMGIDVAVFPDSFSGTLWFLIDCLKYIFFLNVGIGLFNMLPIGPLDGGKVFREFTDKVFSKNTSVIVSRSVSLIISFLIIASLIFPRIF